MANALIDLMAAIDRDGAWNAGCRFFADRGLEHLVCGLLNADGSLAAMMTNMPADYVARYVERGYGASDPWTAHARARGGRLLYDRNEADHLFGPLDAPLTAHLDEQSEAGMARTVFVPIAGDDLHGGLHIGTGNGRREFDAAVGSEGDDLDVAACLVAHALRRDVRAGVSKSCIPSMPHPLLSPREREALCWLASGLRNDRIAERMGVAIVTVNTHIASARRRLNARTREEAVAIAVRAGLISF